MATIDVRYALDQDPARYFLQEDVLLRVRLTNQSPGTVQTPYLLQSDDVELQLKGPGGQIRSTRTLIPVPGTFKPSDVYPLPAGQSVDYALPLATWFDNLAVGQHEVRLVMSSSEVTATSPWLAFEVVAAKPSRSVVVPASSGPSRHLSLLWVDAAMQPSGLLARDHHLNTGPVLTTRLASLSTAPRGLTASMAAPGTEADQPWILWLEGSELRYGQKAGRSLGTVHGTPVAEGLALVAPALGDVDLATDEVQLSVLLTASSPPGLHAVEIAADGSVVGTHRHALPRAPQRAAIAYVSADERWVVWLDDDGGAEGIALLAASWDRSRGFGDPQEIARVAPPVVDLKVAVTDGSFVVGVLTVVSKPDPNGRLLKQASVALVHGSAAAGGGLRSRVESAGVPALAPDVTAVELALSGQGSAWVLTRAPGALRVRGRVGGEWSAVKALDVKGGPVASWLVVDEGEVGYVVMFDEVGGWRVRFADGASGVH
jgi:hypothetical protein